MNYITPSAGEMDQVEAEIRHDYALYGQTSAHSSRITKKRAEELAATLDNCEFREESLWSAKIPSGQDLGSM